MIQQPTVEEIFQELGMTLPDPGPRPKIPNSMDECKTLEELNLYLTWCETPTLGNLESSTTKPPEK